MYDILIVGGGPAGLSAAITAKMRGKSAAILSNDRTDSGFYRAREIGNYPGLPGLSGAELSEKFVSHALGMGATITTGRVNAVLPAGGQIYVSYGSETASAKALILALGVIQTSVFPGEAEFLGRGVSYCATCDGMLYRGKKVCVVCLAPDSEREADHLSSIGVEVVKLATADLSIIGDDRVTSVMADGEEIPCSGVFILRQTIAPDSLMPGLTTQNGHIWTDASMATNIPGIFAAGDCTGAPYQVAKAAGEGQVAALSAAEYIDKNDL